MSERKANEEVRVNGFNGFSTVFKDLSGLVRENYSSSLKTTLSFWEENQKFANAQVEQFLTIHKDYIEQLKATSGKFLPKEIASFYNGIYINGNFDRLADVQRDYINLVRNASEKFTKDAVSLIQKTADKAFSVFEEYLKLFRV